MSSPAESAIATYESTRDAALQRVKDLLAIPTVSTDPYSPKTCNAVPIGAIGCEIGFEATVHGCGQADRDHDGTDRWANRVVLRALRRATRSIGLWHSSPV